MGNVLIFGSINTDFITYTDHLPVPGETITGGTLAVFPGGKGANQAVAAARAGAKVTMFACLGDDDIGARCLANLKEFGIATRHVLIKTGVHSGVALILVDRQGENVISIAPGANYLVCREDIYIPQPSGDGADVCLFQNEIPPAVTASLIEDCKRAGYRILWNTAPACSDKPAASTLQAIDYLIVNRSEMAALVGEGSEETSAVCLRNWGIANIIVTLGAKGALLVSDAGLHYQPAFPVRVVDTVGAGDCFCGVFAAALSSGVTVRESLRRAAAAAALATAARGAQSSMPDAAAIDAFLASFSK